MRPGDGLWRLRGRQLPVEERVALDLFYIRNYTVTLDLQILVQTARELMHRMMGEEDGLARWEEPQAAHPAATGAAAANASAVAAKEPATREESARSVWSRPSLTQLLAEAAEALQGVDAGSRARRGCIAEGAGAGRDHLHRRQRRKRGHRIASRARPAEGRGRARRVACRQPGLITGGPTIFVRSRLRRPAEVLGRAQDG